MKLFTNIISMALSKSVATLLPLLGILTCAVGCQNNYQRAYDSRYANTLGTASVGSNQDLLLENALITDLSPDAMTKRIEWMIDEIFTHLDANPAQVPTPAPPISQCREGTAEPTDDGGVQYCSGGTLYFAQQDPKLRQLLLTLGASADEIDNVRFYRVPTKVANAWATVTEQNIGIIAVYDGLAADAQLRGLDPDSLVAAVLAHELGHIVDMRRSGFKNLIAARKRVSDECIYRLQQVQINTAAFVTRQETCGRAFGANSRTYEYSADNFATEVIGRKLYPNDFDPTALPNWFESHGRGIYNPFESHADGKERGLQYTRALQSRGIIK